jgi:hypothetical protein
MTFETLRGRFVVFHCFLSFPDRGPYFTVFYHEFDILFPDHLQFQVHYSNWVCPFLFCYFGNDIQNSSKKYHQSFPIFSSTNFPIITCHLLRFYTLSNPVDQYKGLDIPGVG